VKLADGTVLPSFLGVNRTPSFDPGSAMHNTRLRIGEVIEIVWPSDPRSRTKRLTEYRVMVQMRSNDTGMGKIFENCILSNPEAGAADYTTWTFRAASGSGNNRKPGSKVLIECINGESTTAVIIGGLRDDHAVDDTSPSKPLQYKQIYNGVQYLVNNDGELFLSREGATDANGNTNERDSTVGANLTLAKDGSVTLADGSGDQGMTLDRANGKMALAASQRTEIGDATDAMLLGESFRNAQQQMHSTIQTALTALQNLLTAAGSNLLATGTALAASPAAAAATPMTAAAAAITAAVTVVSNLNTAIQTFEQAAAAKNSFLSDKRYSD
jgi:hypothetical protein